MKLTLTFTCLTLLAGCQQQQPPPAAEPEEPERLSVTRWTDKTELFMEYPPLVAGETGRFAVHLTSLRDFKAVDAGRVTVRLDAADDRSEAFNAEAPSRPGIFGVDVRPGRAGRHSMVVILNAPGLEDVHELGTVIVHGSRDEIAAPPADAGAEAISFLKEQQWKLDFATAPATEREMRDSLVVAAEVQPPSGGEAEVIAPISGRLASTPVPVIGLPVSQGRSLTSVIPHTPAPADLPALELAVSVAKTDLELAGKARARAERLLAAGAVPARRLEEARAAEATATARLKAAGDRLALHMSSRRADTDPGGSSSFAVRAPISGVVAEVKASPGANVEQGELLFRIVQVSTVYVTGHVPEAEAHRLSKLAGAEIQPAGSDRPVPMRRLVSLSRLIDPVSRTLSVIYEVPNTGPRLAIGQSLALRLFLSGGMKAVAVPESAVVDDGGQPVVFVQMDGESFERRPVKLGARGSGYVQTLEGIQPGERIVTRGAYLIRLAALSTQVPAHGHVH